MIKRIAVTVVLAMAGAVSAADDVKLEATNFDGLMKSIAAHKGKIVVVDVWGTF